MTKGWKHESGRHSLSARGIPNRRVVYVNPKTNTESYEKSTYKNDGKPNKQHSCLERVDEQFEGRMEDLHKLWDAYNAGEEEVEDLGNIYDYGLAFDYVPAETFNDQEQGFFRYQLSWGGPGDEFRFYVDPDMHLYKIEYWFLDWGDGAMKHPKGKDKELMEEIFEWFRETGTVERALKDATEE
jgi:hypothetical protein